MLFNNQSSIILHPSRGPEDMKPISRIILIVVVTIIAVLVVEAGVALAVMWWGLVNVGADNPHPAVVQWYLSNTMERSVQKGARGLQAPAAADVSIAAGAVHYGRTCVLCHGAPGVEPLEIGKGLSPDPPDLIRTAPEWTVEQVYWIVKHGVGDTGMPAFGTTEEEADLWAIASFVKQLPNLTPAEFSKLVAEGTARRPSDGPS